ncbi:ABC transporter permease [Amycolatopsis sp. NPDC098790]|uniref:ABC transporter permease n=1 Tax=Amycolatopsis sp. NPDC098790 TaxID=3363939 RepID=UPI00381C83D0
MTIALLVLKRLAAGVLLLLVLSLLIFSLLSLSPGSPVQTLLGSRPATPDLVAALNAKYHLDQPFLAQYWHWLSGVVRFDFGRSIAIQTDSPVSGIIVDRMGLSIQLSGYAFVLVLLVGLPLGMAAGIRRGTFLDRVISLFATVGISGPAFVVSIVLLYVFGVALGWFPVFGIGEGFGDRLAHLTLPAIAMAVFLSAIIIRQTRAATLTVMRQDYITFARIRGLSPARVLGRYALRNSALPVVTSAGLLLISALTAAVFVEQVFSLPGIGSLLYTAVLNKDIPLVQGMAMVLGAFVVVVNLIVDLLGLALDPRTRVGVKEGG